MAARTCPNCRYEMRVSNGMWKCPMCKALCEPWGEELRGWRRDRWLAPLVAGVFFVGLSAGIAALTGVLIHSVMGYLGFMLLIGLLPTAALTAGLVTTWAWARSAPLGAGSGSG